MNLYELCLKVIKRYELSQDGFLPYILCCRVDCNEAAAKGHLVCLQRIVDLGYESTKETYTLAARNGHLKCISFLHNLTPINNNLLRVAMKEAAQNSHWDVCNFIFGKDRRSPEVKWHEAATEGYLEVCKFLATLHPPSAKNFMWASYHGNLEILKFLHSIQCPMDEYAFMDAAHAHRLDIMQYLIEIGCPIGKSAWYGVGDLDILKYLHEIGCPFDEHVIEEMVATASVEVLDFMVEIGCPIGPRAAELALCTLDDEGAKFILKYLDPNELENPDLCRILKDMGPYYALDAYLYGYDRYSDWPYSNGKSGSDSEESDINVSLKNS